MREHSVEGSDASSQTDVAVAARPDVLRNSPTGPLRAADVRRLQRTAGNRAVARLVNAIRTTPIGVRRRLQRRIATPTRSDRTHTFTYELKLYTVDAESYWQAKEAADRLNTFTGTVFDIQAQADYTVRFAVAVFAPPEPDILEQELGVELHHRVGRKRLRPHRYQEAAQSWWLRFLRQPGNAGNLFLGYNSPSEETKSFIREQAVKHAQSARAEITLEYRRRLAAARRQGSAGAEEDARDFWRKEMARLEENDPERVVQERFDQPVEGSRGTTFSAGVLRLSRMGGSSAYKQSILVHELIHLFGLGFDHADYRESVMSYPYVQSNKDRVVMPTQQDIDALYQYSEPSTNSID